MKTKKNSNNVLREIRRIRNKHYEETKNMSIKERMEYYRKKSESLDERLSKLDYKDGKTDFPFLFHDSESEYRKEKINEENNKILRSLSRAD
ncbi:MAG: hypothetical protein LBU34_18190 [Planctomycetaceae bacterium]|jgi:Fe-S oxidoreductase|nr:hypothetical protein [Planctomycetaceae bacterium]